MDFDWSSIKQIFSWDIVKVLALIVIIYFAHKISHIDWSKKWAEGRKFTKKYGILTVILIIIWWIITPSGGTPDDLVTIWLVATIGIKAYIMLVVALSAYLMYRMGISIVIYEKDH